MTQGQCVQLRRLRDDCKAQNDAIQALMPCIQQRFPGGAVANPQPHFQTGSTIRPVLTHQRATAPSTVPSDISDSHVALATENVQTHNGVQTCSFG